jgi:hypothetical protein
MRVPFGSDDQHRPQCVELDDRIERLRVIELCTLTEPLSNRSRLEAVD